MTIPDLGVDRRAAHACRPARSARRTSTARRAAAAGPPRAPGADAARDLGPGWKISPSVDIAAGRDVRPRDDRRARRDHPHLDHHPHRQLAHAAAARLLGRRRRAGRSRCPYGDFFCSGWGVFAQVNSQPIAVNPHGGFNSYWPMPFRDGRPADAREPVRSSTSRVYYQVTYEIGGDYAGRRLPARPVAAQQPARDRDAAHAPRGRRGPGPLRRHLPRLGRQQQRLVGRGRDQVLPRRRRRSTRRSAAPAPRTTSAAPGTSTCPARATRAFSTPYLGMPQVIRPDGLYVSQQRFGMYRWHLLDPIRFADRAAGRHPGARLAQRLALPAAARRHRLDGAVLPRPAHGAPPEDADRRRPGDPLRHAHRCPTSARSRRAPPD